MTRKYIISIVLTLLLPATSFAQAYQPIDLAIPNILQQEPEWCWVAVAQQIILRSVGPANTPDQCALVAMASNIPPAYCCYNPNQCRRTGHLQEIQALIAKFGGHYSTLAMPANPVVIYNILASGRPIIMAVKSTSNSGHVVVVRGMAWLPHPVLFINDPMQYFTQPVPFAAIAPYWMAAIIVN